MSSLQQMLLGGAGSAIALSNITTVAVTGTPTSFAELDVNNDGSVASIKSASGSWTVGPMVSARWTPLTGTPGSTPFYVKIVPTSGAFTSGDLVNTVLALTSNRTFRVTQSVSGSTTVVYNIEIYGDAGGLNLLARQTGINISATVP